MTYRTVEWLEGGCDDRLLLLLSLLETDAWGSAVGHGGSFPFELQIASICCEVYTCIIWE